MSSYSPAAVQLTGTGAEPSGGVVGCLAVLIEPWLERAAALRPDAIAVEAGDGALTYAELSRRARAGAGEIDADRVAIALPPGLDFAVALHACLLAGAAAVPVDLREPSARLAGAGMVLDGPLGGRGEPRLAGAGMVLDGPLGGRGEPPRRVPDAGDAALVVHTSGTTGVPRPVVLTLGNVLANALGCAIALGHDRAERWLCPLPLSHVGGLMVLLRSAVAGTTAVLGPAQRDDVTVASLVPTQLGRLLEAGRPPGPDPPPG